VTHPERNERKAAIVWKKGFCRARGEKTSKKGQKLPVITCKEGGHDEEKGQYVSTSHSFGVGKKGGATNKRFVTMENRTQTARQSRQRKKKSCQEKLTRP